MEYPQAAQYREELWGLAHVLTQHPRPGVDPLHLRGSVAFGSAQRRTERKVQGEVLLRTLRGVWQGFERCQPSGQVSDCLNIGRTFSGAFSGSLPVGNGL